MSANHRVETLLEASSRGFSIEVRCLRCGKHRVLDTGRLLAIWMRRGWSTRIGRLYEHLRCDACRPVDVQVRLTSQRPDHRRQPRHPDEE